MSLPRYDRYKASDIEWLGEVPEHWKIAPLKYLVRLKSGGTPTKDNRAFWNGSVPWASAKDLKADIIFDTADHITEAALSLGGVELVAERAVLVLVRGMTLAHSFPVVVAGRPMAINQDLKALVARRGLQQTFLAWLLRGSARESLSRIDEAGHGTKALRMEAWTSLRLPVPTSGEQLAIAAFLDRETAKIDALVDEQKRLIELLKEKRQAVISHAVTKGLDPNAPMKDSGVEWLGQVPEHWDVKPLMRLTAPGRDIMYGIVLPGPNVDVGVPIVKGGDVKTHRLRLDLLNKTTFALEAPFARARLRPQDIVYSIRGTIGDAELVPDDLLDANITQDVARVSPRSDVNCRWLCYAVRSRRIFVQLEQRSLGAAVRGINIYDLKRARLPVPPPAAQKDIAEFLDGETGKFNALISEAQSGIELLNERRAALISAAVTGKIDVRNIAAEIAEAAA